jgi:hypothetical protein
MDTEQELNLTTIYNMREVPDKVSGRCDNYGNAQFKSSIKNMTFLRE